MSAPLLPQNHERLAYTVETALKTGAFRTRQKLYQAIARGDIATWKDGRTRMISAASLNRYVERRTAACEVAVAAPPRPETAIPAVLGRSRVTDILKAAKPFDGCAGVYFLIDEEAIVYVGQSKNVYARIQDHKNAGVRFDRWSMVTCRRREMPDLEAHYIAILKPKLNKAGTSQQEATR